LKNRYKIILTLALVNLTLFSLYANVDVNAQTTTYSMAIHDNDEYVWEVTQLDESIFVRVLGYEPNFDVGDRIRVIIDSVEDHEYHWMIYAYFWDYKADWSQQGSYQLMPVRKFPYHYNDSVFLPVPIDDYLTEVESYFEPQYSVDGLKISTIIRAQTDREYLHERVYNDRGVLITECVYEYPINRLFVKVDATFFMIPMGIYFIGFIIIAIAAIATVLVKRRKIILKNS